MDRANRRYVVELLSVLALYAVVLVGSMRVLEQGLLGPVRTLVALAPMVPALFVPVVVVRRLRTMDELQRQIQLEAFGYAFAGTAVITFGYGFLEQVDFPRLSSFAVWPLMGALWCIGIGVARWRFR